jgi:hypothetical protein
MGFFMRPFQFFSIFTPVFLSITFLLSGALFPDAPAAPENPSYIRWEYQPPPRHRNGAAEINLNLVSSDGSPVSDGFWYYKATPLISFRRVMETAPPSTVTGFFKPGENTLNILSGQFIFVEAMGTAMLNGERHYAQTAVLLYGETGKVKPIKSKAPQPLWPSFQFSGSGELYWPQTGHTFTLRARDGCQLGEVSAWSPEGRARGEYVNAEGGRGFVPAADKKLNDQGSAASKPIFFLAEIPGGGSVSYTIYIHRNRYAGENLNLGLIVFFSALTGTGLILGLVFHKRRVFRHVAQGV